MSAPTTTQRLVAALELAALLLVGGAVAARASGGLSANDFANGTVELTAEYGPITVRHADGTTATYGG
ncbi:MAG TPA: hypothetical protein VGC37_18700 [Friedmanniella sp.]